MQLHDTAKENQQRNCLANPENQEKEYIVVVLGHCMHKEGE